MASPADTIIFQVINMTNAIKIACDFISVENLDATLQVSKELRRHRLSEGGEDVLQLLLTLWYAWIHLDTLSPPHKSTTSKPFTCPICGTSKSFPFRNGLLCHL